MPIQRNKFRFTNRRGLHLSAVIEASESPRAWMLYAHCFTCGKDIITASRLSRILSHHGIAVMRFDFTGLGESEGQFSETNFSSNLEDLLDACDYLRQQHQAPSLLMGHSFGGAAVLAMAAQVPECRAVITLAAPAEPMNIFSHFDSAVSRIRQDGQITVSIGGQEISLTRQFLEDIEDNHGLPDLAQLDKAVLFIHAPGDDTVDLEQGEQLFSLAQQPKNFIALEGSDHLLTARDDAQRVANIISAWSQIILPSPGDT